MARSSSELDALAAKAPAWFPNLGDDAISELADLCVRITHVEARRSGAIVSPLAARPFGARSVAERAAMRVTVLRVLQALVVLGWIDASEE